MTREGVAAAVCVGVLAMLLVGAQDATARDTSGTQTAWTVTEGDAVVGTESIRVVRKDNGTLYVSGTRKITSGDSRASRKTHMQRDADGALVKYRRVENKRKGPGIHVFKRGASARVVGVNDDRVKRSDHPGVLNQAIYDGTVWHNFATWTRRLNGDATTMRFFDVVRKTSGQATLTRSGSITVGNKDNEPVELVVWKLAGTPGEELELAVGAKGKLQGVRGSKRTMLRKGWSWTVSAADPQAAPDTAEGADDDTAVPEPGE